MGIQYMQPVLIFEKAEEKRYTELSLSCCHFSYNTVCRCSGIIFVLMVLVHHGLSDLEWFVSICEACCRTMKNKQKHPVKIRDQNSDIDQNHWCSYLI